MYFQFYQQSFMLNSFPLSSKINPNPDLPAAFIPFFRRIFFMACAMKIHLKKNAAANGLELKERLQGLTATDVTHSRWWLRYVFIPTSNSFLFSFCFSLLLYVLSYPSYDI